MFRCSSSQWGHKDWYCRVIQYLEVMSTTTLETSHIVPKEVLQYETWSPSGGGAPLVQEDDNYWGKNMRLEGMIMMTTSQS
jgi:hypothetical protein